jgi:hypothetical protein
MLAIFSNSSTDVSSSNKLMIAMIRDFFKTLPNNNFKPLSNPKIDEISSIDYFFLLNISLIID